MHEKKSGTLYNSPGTADMGASALSADTNSRLERAAIRSASPTPNQMNRWVMLALAASSHP